MLKQVFFFIALFQMTLGQVAIAASFDCQKAVSAVEKIICSNSSIGSLDEDLAKLYKQVSTTERENQRAWIKERNKCNANEDCLTRQYLARIAQLQSLNSGRNNVSVTLEPSKEFAKNSISLTIANLESIHEIDVSIPKHLIQKITCDNVRSVSYNANTSLISSWYARDSTGTFNSNFEHTASCERQYSGTSLSGLCISSANKKPVKVTVSPERFFEVRTPSDNTCVYLDKIPLVFSKVVTGETWSQGNCAQYTQKRVQRLYLAC